MTLNHTLTIAAATLATLSVTSLAAAEPNSAPADGYVPTADPDVVVVEEDKGEEHSVAVLINPIEPVLGAAFDTIVIKPELQIRLSDYLALDILPAYARYYGDTGVDVSALGGHLGLRIAPGGRGLEGTYIVPRVAAIYGEGSADDEAITSTVVAPTLEVGYAWAFGNFVMNAGGGAGYGFTVDGYDIYQDSPVGGLQLLANFSIGFGL